MPHRARDDDWEAFLRSVGLYLQIQHFQSVLHCRHADGIASFVRENHFFTAYGAIRAADAEPDEAYGFFICAAAGPGYAGDGEGDDTFLILIKRLVLDPRFHGGRRAQDEAFL